MNESGGLLDNAEVEFLLQDSGPLPADDGMSIDATAQILGAQEVTMRGDLDKINLADIFQTLSMSKMEGFLRVANPLEQREVYFDDGFVRCLIPNRTETLRLGQRLIRAGYLTADQLRSALLLQKKSRKQLGVILAENEYVSTDEIEDVLRNQVQEDLFNLFTWQHGAFEFYKGKVDDPATLKRLESTPRFEVNGVLLEVARRSDEWHMIIERINSLDDIFEIGEAHDPASLTDDHRVLVQAVDGRRNLRDLADATLLGLFECGRLLRELLDDGALRKISIDDGIDVARLQLESGDVKRSTMTLQALLDRDENTPPEMVLEIAESLASCGENRWAGDLLVEAGCQSRDGEEALRIARRAREISKRSIQVLRFLIEQLSKSGNPALRNELTTSIVDLVESLMADGESDEALEEIAALETHGSDDPRQFTLKARILSKLSRTDEAVDILLGYAETIEGPRQKERLIQVYEHVLKIDYRRKDIAKALKSLHASKLAKRGKIAGIVLSCAALVVVGYWQLDQSRIAGQLETTFEGIEELIAAGNIDGASAAADTALQTFGQSQQIDEMHALIATAKQNQRTRELVQLDQERLSRSRAAAELMGQGDLAGATDLYFSLLAIGVDRGEASEALRKNVTHVLVEAIEQLRELRKNPPEMPALVQTQRERERILLELESKFLDADYARIVKLNEGLDDDRLRSSLSESEYEELSRTLSDMERIYAEGLRIKQAYIAERDQNSIAEELTPLFHAAREHERNFQFNKALEAYRTLAERHPADDQLRVHFRHQVERFSAILKGMTVIGQATQRGDFETARGQLRALKNQYPNIPFDHLARLPLMVETVPPGASVIVDGKVVGRSPMLTSFVPARNTQIRIELDRYLTEEATISDDSHGVVWSLLSREHDWSHELEATVDRTPVVDGNRVYLADRNGTLTALQADGTVLWKRATGDLSGFLSSPVRIGSRTLVVASIDGKLRRIDAANGKVVWAKSGYPSSIAPVGIDDVVGVAANETFYGVQLKTGEQRYSVPLGGDVEADLLRRDGVAFVVTTNGTARAIRLRDGRVRWTARVGAGCVATPALGSDHLAIVADDGSVSVLDPSSGETRWRSRRFSSLTVPAAIHGNRLFIAEDRELSILDLSNGRRLEVVKYDAPLKTPLTTIGDLLFLGDASGQISALDPRSLDPRFLLRGTGQALAPVARLADGTFIACYGDRSVRGIRRD